MVVGWRGWISGGEPKSSVCQIQGLAALSPPVLTSSVVIIAMPLPSLEKVPPWAVQTKTLAFYWWPFYLAKSPRYAPLPHNTKGQL